MGWYCVHIEHIRVEKATNATFRKMLIEEYRGHNSPHACHVYVDRTPGGYFYFFSPDAGEILESFVEFWKGFECPEPTDLERMELVI